MTALDFETTGSIRNQESLPWQIGLVTLLPRDCSPDKNSLFSSLLQVPADFSFNPYTPGRWAEKRAEIEQATTLPALWEKLAIHLQNRPLVAHNCPTERTILKKSFPFHQFPLWIDTLVLFRKAYPNLPGYSLSELLDTFRLTEKVAEICPDLAPHDSLYDAVGCGILLQHLRTLPGWATLSLEELLELSH